MRRIRERLNHKGLLHTVLPCISTVTLSVTPRLPIYILIYPNLNNPNINLSHI